MNDRRRHPHQPSSVNPDSNVSVHESASKCYVDDCVSTSATTCSSCYDSSSLNVVVNVSLSMLMLQRWKVDQ